MREALELVKLRKVAGSVVLSIPESILSEAGLSAGDKLLLFVDDNKRIVAIEAVKAIDTILEAERTDTYQGPG